MSQNENDMKKERGGRTITDLNTTLGDLGDRDRDNFQHLMKTSTCFDLSDFKQASQFMMICFNRALQKCGLVMKEKIELGSSKYKKLLKKNNMRVETRMDYEDDELIYIPGIYIYKNNEIAGFVSRPLKKKIDSKILSLLPQAATFSIITTEKMDDYRNMSKKEALLN